MKKITNIPSHIGIILDGNGRWATRRGLSRLEGHKKGADAIRKMLVSAKKFKIKVVSVFAFSTENWKRSKDEVDGIFKILENMIDQFEKNFINNGYKLSIMGDINKLNKSLQEKIKSLIEKSKNNNQLIFNVGLNYGGRAEIVNATNQILQSNLKYVDEKAFESYLYTKNLPPLDFVIRTSGEQRISNFMLWQIAYSELYFPKYFWPSFNERKLKKCLIEFSKRKRRFGAI